MIDKLKAECLIDWLLPMLMNGQVQVNSNLNDATVVDGGLGMVAESGAKYVKG